MFDTVSGAQVARINTQRLDQSSWIAWSTYIYLFFFFFFDTHLTDLRAGVILFRWRRYGRRIRWIFLNRGNRPGKIDRRVQQQRNNRLHLRDPCDTVGGGKKNFDKARDTMGKIYIATLLPWNFATSTFFLLFVWRLKSNICFLSYYFCNFFTINYIIEYSINLSIKKNFFLKKFISSSLSRESFWKDVKKKGVLNIVRNIKFEISLKQNEILERINKTFESPCTFPVIQTMNFPIKLRNYPTSVSLYAIGCTQG